jgi:hypothetical protein
MALEAKIENQYLIFTPFFVFPLVIALSGMLDVQGKPVLICSLNDNSVRLYDLPS